MLKRKDYSNIFFNAAYHVSNILFPLITFPYVSRVLGVEGLGAASLALITATYFSTMAAMGIPIYGVREVSRCKGDKNKLGVTVSELLLINAVGVVVALLFYFYIVFNVSEIRGSAGLYYIASINIVLSLFQVDWLFQGLKDFKVLAIRSLFSKMLSMVLIFLLVRNAGDIDIYVLINVLALSAANLINIYTAIRTVPLVAPVGVRKHIKPIFVFLLTRVMSTVYTLLDVIILGVMTSSYSVGLYVVAVRIVRVITALVASVTMVFFSDSSSMNKGSSSYEELIQNVFSLLLITAIPSSIFIFIFSDDLVFLFAGEDFMPAGNALRILSGIIVIAAFSNFTAMQVLYANGLEKAVATSLAVGAGVCVAVMVLLTPSYMHNGAAVALFLAEASVLLYQIIAIKFERICMVRFFGRRTLNLLICVLAYAITMFLVDSLTIALEAVSRICVALLCAVFVIPVSLLLVREKLIISLCSRFFK